MRFSMSSSTSCICGIKIKYIFLKQILVLKRECSLNQKSQHSLSLTSRQFIQLWQTYVFTSVLSNVIMILLSNIIHGSGNQKMTALLLCLNFQKMKKYHQNMLHIACLLLYFIKLGDRQFDIYISNDNLHFALSFHMQTFHSL